MKINSFVIFLLLFIGAACQGQTASIASLPYFQNFDSVTVPALPEGWSSIRISSYPVAVAQTENQSSYSQPNSGYMFNYYDLNSTLMLVSPRLENNLPINQTLVRFMGCGTPNTQLAVGIMSDLADPSTFECVEIFTMPSGWISLYAHFENYN